MTLEYCFGISTVLSAMICAINPLTFGKFSAIKGTKVEGSWQKIPNVDKGYKCCIQCGNDANCTAVNYNADIKTCEMVHASENGQFSLIASSGWSGYFTDLKNPDETAPAGAVSSGSSLFTGVNPLSNAVATQSSNYLDYIGGAEAAIDGNTNGYFYGGGSCAHTAPIGNFWWMVDFHGRFSVSAVVLWNRLDMMSGQTFYRRLKELALNVGSSVSSLDYKNSLCAHYTGPPLYRFDNPVRVNCTRVMYGRFLKIEKLTSNTGPLALCEVQVVQ